MNQNFQPIKPAKGLIEYYNQLWENGTEDNILIRLSDTDSSLSIPAHEAGINFSEIKRGEIILDEVFAALKGKHTERTEEAVLLLDCIYHTQIKDSLHFAVRLREKIDNCSSGESLITRITEASTDMEKAKCIDEIASLVKDEPDYMHSAYSFATKFCSRLCPDKYPIFDGYVAWLLNKYVPDAKKPSPARFGSYETFLETYDKLKGQLGTVSYKDIDVFMWTYGKALNKYAEKVNKENKEKNESPKGLKFKADVTYKRP